MKWAIFGGSFDPVHLGHVAVADAVHRHLRPDCLFWIPARQAPHKPEAQPLAGSQRLALLEALCQERDRERVLDLELRREGPSFTVDTLQALAGNNPEAELWLVMGADSLSHLATWHRFSDLLTMAKIALVPRPGWGLEQLQTFADRLSETQRRSFRAHFLDMEEVDLSSTEIRRRLLQGQDCSHALPAAVAELIRRRKLYCSPS
ncbi:MAG: nicotinate (nicotinamide) nucleotide adenylyltransferase [Planctomycetota bacterium]|nr:MAG: nicotinate (nicotinamide) nucleotide adenylyltransferase [Planctomycetota bacterium]